VTHTGPVPPAPPVVPETPDPPQRAITVVLGGDKAARVLTAGARRPGSDLDTVFRIAADPDKPSHIE
jgi:hypothetical protein